MSQFIANYHSSTYKDFILSWRNTTTTSRGFVTGFSRPRVWHSTAEPLRLHKYGNPTGNSRLNFSLSHIHCSCQVGRHLINILSLSSDVTKESVLLIPQYIRCRIKSRYSFNNVHQHKGKHG